MFHTSAYRSTKNALRSMRQERLERQRQIERCNPFKNPDGTQWCDVESRIARIKEITDVQKAKDALFYCNHTASVQSTVRRAAEVQVRKLEKAA